MCSVFPIFSRQRSDAYDPIVRRIAVQFFRDAIIELCFLFENSAIDSYQRFCRDPLYAVLNFEARLQIIVGTVNSSKLMTELKDDYPEWEDLLTPDSLRFLFDPKNEYYQEGSDTSHDTAVEKLRESILVLPESAPRRNLMISFTKAVLGDVLDGDRKVSESGDRIGLVPVIE